MGRSETTIVTGYVPGIVGRCVEMHAQYYARTVRFGRAFEAKVAAELAEFIGRLDHPTNEIWTALQDGQAIGTVAIDGEDLGAGLGHLRWFIVSDQAQGSGIGRHLLSEAIAFCDRNRFRETQLWTFHGLDAARHLYETNGFSLKEERSGRQWGSEVLEQRFVRPMPTGG